MSGSGTEALTLMLISTDKRIDSLKLITRSMPCDLQFANSFFCFCPLAEYSALFFLNVHWTFA